MSVAYKFTSKQYFYWFPASCSTITTILKLSGHFGNMFSILLLRLHPSLFVNLKHVSFVFTACSAAPNAQNINKIMQLTFLCISLSIYYFSFYITVCSYLDALQPPPHSITAVVSGTATLTQQVGDQTVTQRPRKGQDDVTMETI